MLMLLSDPEKGRFRLSLPTRRAWGSLWVHSGHPQSQVLTRPVDWLPGFPIPEGLYLLGPMDVAGWTSTGQPDWSASFAARMPGPFYRDLIPAWHHLRRPSMAYSLRAMVPGQVPDSDIYLGAQSDLDRLYEWGTQSPLDMLAVNYGLGSHGELDTLDWGFDRTTLMAIGQ